MDDMDAGLSNETSPMGRRPIPGTTIFPLSCFTLNSDGDVDDVGDIDSVDNRSVGKGEAVM